MSCRPLEGPGSLAGLQLRTLKAIMVEPWMGPAR